MTAPSESTKRKLSLLQLAKKLDLREINVSPSGVRGVWRRHDLETRHK